MNYRHIYMQIISAAKNQQKLGLRPKNQNQRKIFQINTLNFITFFQEVYSRIGQKENQTLFL